MFLSFFEHINATLMARKPIKERRQEGVNSSGGEPKRNEANGRGLTASTLSGNGNRGMDIITD